MKSKIAQLCEFLKGTSHIPQDGLADYHAALAARNANRCGTTGKRLSEMKRALARYPVTVSHDGMGNIVLHNRATGARYIATA